MKKTVLAIVTLLCMAFVADSAFAFTAAEKNAQKALSEYLTNRSIANQLSDKDNSVNFLVTEKTNKKTEDILYWVTFEEKGNNILYTMHRRPVKMVHPNPEVQNRDIEQATYAANMINADNPFKAYVKDGRIEFVYPMLAATPADYFKVFTTQMNSLRDAKSEFDRNIRRAKVTTDSIHNYWATNDTSIIVVPQNKVSNVQSGKSLKITSADFRNVGADGTVKSGYNENIRKDNVMFIQPKITVTSETTGNFRIGVKIITPKGKVLKPSRESFMTILTPTEIKKKGKPIEIELDSFGIKDGSIWQAGEYRVLFYEDDREIFSTTFNIL